MRVGVEELGVWGSWGTVGLDLLNSAHTFQLLGVKNESEHENN